MYKIFDRRTCGLSHQIKGPVIVNLTILQFKPVLANFTVVGPLIWCDNPHVRLSKILYINNNDFHNLGRSQMCAGACYVFRTSKPHSRTLWIVIVRSRHWRQNQLVRVTQLCEIGRCAVPGARQTGQRILATNPWLASQHQHSAARTDCACAVQLSVDK